MRSAQPSSTVFSQHFFGARDLSIDTALLSVIVEEYQEVSRLSIPSVNISYQPYYLPPGVLAGDICDVLHGDLEADSDPCVATPS